MQLTRRDLIKLGIVGSAALVLPVERGARALVQQAARLDPALLPTLGQLPFLVPPEAVPRRTQVTVPGTWVNPHHESGRDPVKVNVDYYESRMRQVELQILPPPLPKTSIWGYQGTTPGPTIHAERGNGRLAEPGGRPEELGRPVLVRHYNDLSEQHPVLLYGPPQTSVHLHGNPSLPQHDGYASDTTSNNEYKDYWYPSIEDARTLWYHDHGVHHTASNAYMGLAGQYHLHDDVERDSGLPMAGMRDGYGQPYDVPVTLRDAMFDTNGQLIFDDNFESGAFGDVILVNGVPWPNMVVEPRQYRFRILNAAISRSFELALAVKGSKTRLPLTVVGTDGGIMEIAQGVTALRIGMAERYEVVIDFSKLAGKTLVMSNLRPKNNIEYAGTGNVMQFTVGTTVTSTARNATAPGTRLRTQKADCMGLVETSSMPQRTVSFDRSNGHWVINGKTWADVVRSGFKSVLFTPKLNDVEVWTIKNLHGGWFHPVHIHLIDFQILSRTGDKRNGVQAFEKGPKDVVYVGENETVKLIARFGPQPGRYMIHCHNLVHEDHDMMHQFWVKGDNDTVPIDYDPMGSRAAKVPSDGSVPPLQLPGLPGGGPQYPPAGV